MTKYPFVFRYELTGDQSGIYADSDRPNWGVGEESFAYKDCCLNVLDIATVFNTAFLRRTPPSCAVNNIRTQSQRNDGLRSCIPVDASYNFPRLDLRYEVSTGSRWYSPTRLGVNVELYNPEYFQLICGQLAEQYEQRQCFQPIYVNECLDTSSPIYHAPVAFWTGTYASRVAEGSVPARSAVWGFEPALFNPSMVRQAMEIILCDEWKLPRY